MSEARIHIDAQLQVRRDTEANWAAVDPVLRDGEIAYSKDTKRLKIGDGASRWAKLEYLNTGGTGGVITNVLGPDSLGAVPESQKADYTITFNAYAIDSIYKRLNTFASNLDAKIAQLQTSIAENYLSVYGGQVLGDIRLKGSGNYGNHLYFGDGSYCYLWEDEDDHLTILADKGIELYSGTGFVQVNGEKVLVASAIMGYATESWVNSQGFAKSSVLGDYLPTSGGIITGNLYVQGDITCDGDIAADGEISGDSLSLS